jgi:hypothetical protein
VVDGIFVLGYKYLLLELFRSSTTVLKFEYEVHWDFGYGDVRKLVNNSS